MADGQHRVLLVVDDEGEKGERDHHAAGAAADGARQAVPDRSGHGEGYGGNDDGVRTAYQPDHREQQEASGRGAGEVEEVDAVHVVDGFADGERDDRAGHEERQRGGEVDQREVPVGKRIALAKKDRQGHDDQQAVDQAQTAEPGKQRGLPSGDDIGKDAAQAEAEERDRNRQEGEVIVEDDRKNARQGEFKKQRRHGGEGYTKVDLTPLGRIRFHGGQTSIVRAFERSLPDGRGSPGRIYCT